MCRVGGWFFLVLFSGLLCSGCGQEGEAQESEEQDLAEIRTVAVKVRPVELRSFTDYFNLLGTVRGRREATLVFEVGGVLDEVIADKGAFVRKGEPIARLNDELVRAQFDEARAALSIAEETYERSVALRSKGAISELELSGLEHDYEMAKARFSSAEVQLDRATLKAAFDGIVDARFLDEGDYANPLSPYARLIDIRKIQVEVPIPEIHLACVKHGDEAWVTADQYPDRTFEGDVTFVSREVDESTRTVVAEVRIENGDGLLRPGMTVRVRLAKEVYQGAVVVPQDAVVNTEEGLSVFVAREGKATSRPVKIGTVYGELAVVESGLAEGESLIVVGARDLVHGESIEVQP